MLGSNSLQVPTPLWSDDPAEVDLLGSAAVAATAIDAVLNEALDPVAIGVSGCWGSGKTTVLRLVRTAIEEASDGDRKVLVVLTDPWRYDPSMGPKESLINEVLATVKGELESRKDTSDSISNLLKRLAGRVRWSRAIHLAAKTSLAFQLPSFKDLLDLVNFDPSGEGTSEPDPGLAAFREEFGELLGSSELGHVRRVVVLVDDLDRCLPETVVDTLEAIKLFLAVPKMSFVIAADEDRVAEALMPRFPQMRVGSEEQGETEPATRLYLHKIVQTTIPLPALSRFDTEAYLALLLLQLRLQSNEISPAIARCNELRRESGNLDDLADAVSCDISSELALAARLTPILYEKLHGNPRRIKRFLNDLHVRRAVAGRRGIELDMEVVAKLMVLEVLLPNAFGRVLDWLARNELREKMQALETASIGAPADQSVSYPEATGIPQDQTQENATVGSSEWGDDMVRWAKLPPRLGGIDLAPYFHLAAAFGSRVVLDTGLPERLRDIAANLASSVRAEQKSVTDDDLRALTSPDAVTLAEHLSRAARDRPSDQSAIFVGLRRVSRIHPSAAEAAARLLRALPPDGLQPGAILRLTGSDIPVFRGVFEGWRARLADGPARRAIDEVLGAEKG